MTAVTAVNILISDFVVYTYREISREKQWKEVV